MDVSGVTHYEVLGLSREMLDEAEGAQRRQHMVKRAYHRALLRHHPDKAAASTSAGKVFTVDQISAASVVLSDPARRKEYDAALRLSRTSSAAGVAGRQPDFQTGVEIVDLDDLDADHERGLWSRSCRCGNERGFELTEHDLEAVADEGELLVGCQDCSLWLMVHFSVLQSE